MFGIDTRSKGYTRTSTDNLFTKASNWLSMVPGIPGWQVFGTPLVALLGGAGAVVDAAGWLFRGKVGSALTALVAGGVSTTVNTAVSASGASWWAYGANVASGLVTGRSLGTHARAATEGLISAATKPLGMQPTVLRSYPAALAFNGGNGGPVRGGFLEAEASRRGQTVDQAWSRVNSNQGDHVAALENARAQGGAQQQLG